MRPERPSRQERQDNFGTKVDREHNCVEVTDYNLHASLTFKIEKTSEGGLKAKELPEERRATEPGVRILNIRVPHIERMGIAATEAFASREEKDEITPEQIAAFRKLASELQGK